ncbi:MAG: flavin reductase [Nitrospirota bacterium]
MTASFVKAPLISECYASLECKVVDEKMVAKCNFFILEVLKAWIDPTRKDPRTVHHCGRGVLMVAGETIKVAFKNEMDTPATVHSEHTKKDNEYHLKLVLPLTFNFNRTLVSSA